MTARNKDMRRQWIVFGFLAASSGSTSRIAESAGDRRNDAADRARASTSQRLAQEILPAHPARRTPIAKTGRDLLLPMTSLLRFLNLKELREIHRASIMPNDSAQSLPCSLLHASYWEAWK